MFNKKLQQNFMSRLTRCMSLDTNSLSLTTSSWTIGVFRSLSHPYPSKYIWLSNSKRNLFRKGRRDHDGGRCSTCSTTDSSRFKQLFFWPDCKVPPASPSFRPPATKIRVNAKPLQISSGSHHIQNVICYILMRRGMMSSIIRWWQIQRKRQRQTKFQEECVNDGKI